MIRSSPEEHRVQPLTAKQERVLRYVQDVTRVQGEPPTARAIARHFEVDLRTVQGYLEGLYRKGHLRTPSPGGLWCRHADPAEILSAQDEPTPSN